MEICSLRSALFLFAVLTACENRPAPQQLAAYESPEFHDYWHAGKAEVNSYELIQSRYGEARPGKAVLIFVTEDLSKKSQVKLDDPSRGAKINVLKLNFTKKFVTGIYPYSLMLSVFTPTNLKKEPSSLKTSMSSQEWCGQTYTQMNLRGNRYAVKSHSYFEGEADQQFSLRQQFLEDEIWNYIRLDHQHLPVGNVKMIPGLFYTRLHHVVLKAKDAVAAREESDSAYTYSVTYPEQEHTISVHYEKQFPHKILGWDETWLEKGKKMRTSAQLDKTLYIDYWTKNSNEFLHLRDSLDLPTVY